MRTAYDFSPLYRSMIGFDRMANLIETTMRSEGGETYPPYDIQKIGENTYRVRLAAGMRNPASPCEEAGGALTCIFGAVISSERSAGDRVPSSVG